MMMCLLPMDRLVDFCMARTSIEKDTVDHTGKQPLQLLRWVAAGLACTALVGPAMGQAEPTLTIHGTGSASKSGTGAFSVTLPDGTPCTASFSGGTISLFGKSATRTKATCTIEGLPQPVPTVVHRRLNGSPKEAILTFRDGTKVLVIISPAVETPAAQ